MTDASTYPDAVDPDLRATILAEAGPDAFRDILATMADGIRQVQLALGTNPAVGGLQVVTDETFSTVLAEDSYSAVNDATLRMTVPDGHAEKMLVTFQAVPTCVDAQALVWMPDDGSGTPLADMVTVAMADAFPRPGLTCVQFVLDPAPEGEFQLRWGHMAFFQTDTNVSTTYGDQFGPAVMTAQGAT